MSTQENRTLMNRLFYEAFNEKKLKVLDEICAPPWFMKARRRPSNRAATKG